MAFFTQWPVALAGLALLLFVRSFLILLSAEQGRKRDLVKRLTSPAVDFSVAVILPLSEPLGDDPQGRVVRSDVLTLLQALANQSYPLSKFSIQLACSARNTALLRQEQLPANLRIWTYQAADAQAFPDEEGEAMLSPEALRGWLVDRVLATSSPDLCVFIEPGDIVKSDFLITLVSKAMEASVIQGYVATRVTASGWSAQISSLLGRLKNRIETAGRYHARLVTLLQHTGFAIKPDLLEKLPLGDATPADYSLQLYHYGVPVFWAPSVVVFRKAPTTPLALFAQFWQDIAERAGLLWRHGFGYLTAGLFRAKWARLELLLALVSPGALGTMTLVLAGLLVARLLPASLLEGVPGWLVGTVLALCALSALTKLLVARCKPLDYAQGLLLLPLVYLGALAAAPWLAFQALLPQLHHSFGHGGALAARKAKNTRFNETLPPLTTPAPSPYIAEALDSLAHYPQDAYNHNEAADVPYQAHHGRAPVARASVGNGYSSNPMTPPLDLSRPEGQAALMAPISIPLTNGQKTVHCVLRIHPTQETLSPGGEPITLYHMTLEYKGQGFTSAKYKLLDQAFYELQAKLMENGLGFVSCGSCGYFYNPSADKTKAPATGLAYRGGYCLFGREGQEVDLDTDKITVVSRACQFHAPLERRAELVRAWQESLQEATPSHRW